MLQGNCLFPGDNDKDSTATVSGPELLLIDVSSKTFIDLNKSKTRVYISS